MPLLQPCHGLTVGGAGAQLLVALQAALVFGGADIDLAVRDIGESGAVPHFQVGQHLGTAEVGGGSSGGGRGVLGEGGRSEEHTSELQSQSNLVCRLLLEKKKKNIETN